MKYFVCAIPPEPVYSELDKIINDLSVEYLGPRFFPHMTVLGNIDREQDEIQKAVEIVASETQSFHLSLGRVSTGESYFQSVFIRLNSSVQLINLNLVLKRMLNMENINFIPHASIMYGNQTIETKERIAKNVIIQNKGFVVTELAIVSDKPNPEEWVSMITVPFGKGSPNTSAD